MVWLWYDTWWYGSIYCITYYTIEQCMIQEQNKDLDEDEDRALMKNTALTVALT